MNRFVWDLRYAPPGAEDPENDFGRPVNGPQVLPGTYTVRLTVGGRSYTQPLKVTLDPRSTATPAELQKQFDLCDLDLARHGASRRGCARRRARRTTARLRGSGRWRRRGDAAARRAADTGFRDGSAGHGVDRGGERRPYAARLGLPDRRAGRRDLSALLAQLKR